MSANASVKTLSKSLPQTPYLRLAYSAPVSDGSTIRELHRLTMPATKALPFVKSAGGDNPLSRPESYWNVEPIGTRRIGVQLGRQYAREAIAAMEADRNGDLIALILQDMIKDAVARSRKKGRASHGAIALGFLAEISETIAHARDLSPDPGLPQR
jgi:hypothetical protein